MRHSPKRLTLATLVSAAVMNAHAQTPGTDPDIRAPEVPVNVDRLQIGRDQASVPVRVLTREQIDKLAVRDLSGALALLPNVNIQRTGSLFDEGSVNMYGHLRSGAGTDPHRNRRQRRAAGQRHVSGDEPQHHPAQHRRADRGHPGTRLVRLRQQRLHRRDQHRDAATATDVGQRHDPDRYALADLGQPPPT